MKIEKYSISFVPLSERYGSEKRLFTIWFSINLSIVCLTVGTLGILSGLDLTWTVLALVAGNAIGTVFMAAHSAQGPHLGIPQMIQSRAQFGVLGAAIPLIAVIITYVLYISADQVVIRATVLSLVPVGPDAAMSGFGFAALIVAFIGYELIHRIGVYLTFLSGLLFLSTAMILFLRGLAHATLPVMPGGNFNLSTFMATFTQATAWSLTFGPYVADYSRYLRPEVPTSRTFWYTAAGNFLGASLIMCLGAIMASYYAQIAADP
ncbi:MAG TPA: cytosine permease, partial [Rhizomicrobium sp.]|nr:cytosine permease [Rhizomicrobium sp.]